MGSVLQPLWADCPAVTRVICASGPLLSLATWVLHLTPFAWLTPFLFDCSLLAVQRLHRWALVLSNFSSTMSSGGMSFVMGVILIYMAMVHFPRREKEIGST